MIRDLTGYTAGADRLAEITIPQLWRGAGRPHRRAGRRLPLRRPAALLDDTRPVRDALGALVQGHLAGLFDAPTTIAVDWRAPIQSLSLSRLDPLGDEAVGVALTCLNSWGRAMTALAEPGDLRVVVRDECWKQMRLGWTRSSPWMPTCGCRAVTAACRSSSPTSPPTCSPSATPTPKPSRSPAT